LPDEEKTKVALAEGDRKHATHEQVF
jgi:hypothetical protein